MLWLQEPGQQHVPRVADGGSRASPALEDFQQPSAARVSPARELSSCAVARPVLRVPLLRVPPPGTGWATATTTPRVCPLPHRQRVRHESLELQPHGHLATASWVYKSINPVWQNHPVFFYLLLYSSFYVCIANIFKWDFMKNKVA